MVASTFINQLQTIMFDMDGTLLDLAFDNHFWQEAVPAAWAAAYQYDVNVAKTLLYPQFKAQEGHLNWYSLDYWSTHLKLDLALLKQNHAEKIKIRPHVLAALDVLKALHKPIWLVTNAHPTALAIKLQQTQLAGFFDVIVSSHNLGAAKESPVFWQKLQQLHPYEASKSLLVDDSLAVLKTAYNCGLHVLAISQPDSGLPARSDLPFNAINHLPEMLAIEHDLHHYAKLHRL